ncbi:MAG TPA: zinc-dependent metalloprotease, partial [Niastella sp.]|nr:zinc-dependent metalloprotease [Niastella sp.]
NVYEPTPKTVQKTSVAWLHQFVFTTPDWLLYKNILNKIADPVNNPTTTIQNNVLNNLLSVMRLNRMLESSNRFGAPSYSVLELFSDLKAGIWQELQTGKKTDMYRRNLQKAYVDRMIALVSPAIPQPAVSGMFTISFGPNIKNTDLPSIARGHLSELLADIRSASKMTTDKLTKYHLLDLAQRIDVVLNPR